MDVKLGRRVQLAAPGSLVELFDIDLTPVDASAPILHFYPGSKENAGAGQINWRGNAYFPLPIKIEGIDTGARGSLPRPVISVSNVLGAVTDIIRTYGRISGGVLTRWQTFSNYLDNGEDPNPDGHLPIDQYILDRVQAHNRLEVQIECRSFLDFSVSQVPARLVLQSACSHTYRLWDPITATFNYVTATCPYNGTASFDAEGNPVSSPQDDCGRELSDCRLRFGTEPLPTRAFPGAGRFR